MTPPAMPFALVTGATGFIGGHLARQLASRGWRVRLLVRHPGKLAPSLHAGSEVVTGDLANVDALAAAVRGVAVVFHCAANVSTWDRWDAYHSANVSGVENLLNAIRSHNPRLSRLVHLSTVDVYGFPVAPCNEECATPATGFGYGDSKRMGESLVRQFAAESGVACTIIRPANVIGPGSPFIERIGKELTSGTMMTIDGGRANAGVLYIDNLVDYLIWAAQSERAIGRCYNVRDPDDVTWARFLAVFRSLLGSGGRTLDLRFATADTLAWVCETVSRTFLPGREPLLHRLLVRLFGRTCGHDAARIRADSGIAGGVPFDEAMRRSVEWLKQ